MMFNKYWKIIETQKKYIDLENFFIDINWNYLNASLMWNFNVNLLFFNNFQKLRLM